VVTSDRVDGVVMYVLCDYTGVKVQVCLNLIPNAIRHGEKYWFTIWCIYIQLVEVLILPIHIPPIVIVLAGVGNPYAAIGDALIAF